MSLTKTEISKRIAKIIFPGKALETGTVGITYVTLEVNGLEEIKIAYKPMSDGFVGKSQLMTLTLDILKVKNGQLNVGKFKAMSHAEAICLKWLELFSDKEDL